MIECSTSFLKILCRKYDRVLDKFFFEFYSLDNYKIEFKDRKQKTTKPSNRAPSRVAKRAIE